MLGIKSHNTARIGICIFLAVLVIIVILWARNSTFPRQASYNVFHYLTGQEISLKTNGFKEAKTEHFIIKYEPIDEAYVGLIGKTAEEAYISDSEIFGRKPDQITTIVVYPNSASLAYSFGWDKDEKALGVYYGGSIRILSPREWLSGGDIQAKFAKDGPMYHEFAHLLVDEITKGNYNRWWTEGIAQYVEKKTTGFEFTDPFAGKSDIKYYQLSVLAKNYDQLDQQVAYWESLKAIEYIADNYGEDKLFTIMDYLGKGNTMAQAIRNSLGIDMKTFETGFRENIGIL